MKRIENIRGATLNEKGEVTSPSTKGIEQTFEGRTYVWGPGESMDLPDSIGNWMIQRLNSFDRNEGRDNGDKKAWVREVEVPESARKDAELSVVRANVKAKKAEPAAAAGGTPTK